MYKIATIFFIFFLQGCNQNIPLNETPIKIDFSQKETNRSIQDSVLSDFTVPVAVSAMISPRENFKYYQDLISYISKKTNISFKIVQRKTYEEVNKLLRSNEVSLAFICSGAYVAEKKKSDIEILAVPVCNNKTLYYAYIITNKNSGLNTFEDLKNKSFAFTDPLSNTGKLYVIKRLKDINSTEKEFFSKTVYTHAHDISMQLVSKNIIDGASVDGLIFEYYSKFNPERVSNLKIIEKSEGFGIPPIVVPKNLNPSIKNKIKSVFLSLHKDPEGKKILDKLLIDKFIAGKDSNYNSIRKIERYINE
jgi:phosphonate transport system substrate-binding protein